VRVEQQGPVQWVVQVDVCAVDRVESLAEAPSFHDVCNVHTTTDFIWGPGPSKKFPASIYQTTIFSTIYTSMKH